MNKMHTGTYYNTTHGSHLFETEKNPLCNVQIYCICQEKNYSITKMLHVHYWQSMYKLQDYLFWHYLISSTLFLLTGYVIIIKQVCQYANSQA